MYGVVRVSTAFEFYMALYEHLKLEKSYETIEAKYKKSPMAATNYELYFVAADHADAFGKPLEHVHIILDRSKMWNASTLPGSSNVYEVAGVTHEKQNEKTGAEYNIWMKFLPCPCAQCFFDKNNDLCENINIVGEKQYNCIVKKDIDDIPDELFEPLLQYTAPVLLGFLKKNNIRFPSGSKKNKTEYVDLIRKNLSGLVKIIPEPDMDSIFRVGGIITPMSLFPSEEF
jgi:hypothetical protein